MKKIKKFGAISLKLQKKSILMLEWCYIAEMPSVSEKTFAQIIAEVNKVVHEWQKKNKSKTKKNFYRTPNKTAH